MDTPKGHYNTLRSQINRWGNVRPARIVASAMNRRARPSGNPVERSGSARRQGETKDIKHVVVLMRNVVPVDMWRSEPKVAAKAGWWLLNAT